MTNFLGAHESSESIWAEVGKVTLKSKNNEALSNESLLKSYNNEALSDDSLKKK
jgi:hypothetical protein